MKTVLTIAGSDSIGGAGIQADIKSISANGCYAMSVITSVTAQNTLGVNGVFNIPADFVRKQLDSVFDDIRPDAVKIGMLPNKEIINTVADVLSERYAENIVVDTVMISTSGHRLMAEEAVTALIERIFPIAAVVTPNIFETEVISGMEIETDEDIKNAAVRIRNKGCLSVLIKGGHRKGNADDLLYDGNEFSIYRNAMIDNPNTHGTGCTLSSAIAANLAKGYSTSESVGNAKKYLTGAIADGLDIGKGCGPLNHFYRLSTDNATCVL